MTGEILQHLEVLTRYRDTSLLKVSLMNTMLSLTKVAEVRLFDVIDNEGEFLLALSAWSEGGEVLGGSDMPLDDQIEAVEPGSRIDRALRTRSQVSMDDEGRYETSVPILLADKPIAIFECVSSHPMTGHEQDVLEGVIGVFRNYLDLLHDSQHDTLTGLLNRKTFEHGFVALLTPNRQMPLRLDEQRQLVNNHWLAVVDIDHFKRINDQLGHLYGDEVLILMANLMRRSFRRHDRLYRFGGEEFVILMRNVGEGGVHRKLEHFREVVEQYHFPQIGRVTISVGYAAVAATDTSSAVIGKADEALYFAKAHGRNQVCCYEQLISSGDLTSLQSNNHAEFF